MWTSDVNEVLVEGLTHKLLKGTQSRCKEKSIYGRFKLPEHENQCEKFISALIQLQMKTSCLTAHKNRQGPRLKHPTRGNGSKSGPYSGHPKKGNGSRLWHSKSGNGSYQSRWSRCLILSAANWSHWLF
jgi:hypothetical protein